MLKKILGAIKKYLLNFVQAHLFILLISLPILIWWGIPISKMSIIGNLIFSPFLIIFLVLSSLIFFTQLCFIPNNFLIVSLEKTTILWQKILELGKKEWLLPFAKQHLCLLILIPLSTFLLLSFKTIDSIQKRIAALALLVMVSLISFFYNGYSSNLQKTQTLYMDKKSKNKLLMKKEQNMLEINDFGFFNRKKSINKFVEFELRPYLIKTFGTLAIKNLTIFKPSSASFKAAEEFCDKCKIKKVTIPLFKKPLTKYEWKCFLDMKKKLKQSNVLLEHTEQPKLL